MTLNEIEQRNNQYNYNQSYNQDSESNNAIIILIGLGIFILGAVSTIKKTSMIKLLSSINYRFSPSYKKDNFNRKVDELKNLLDSGIISQTVYDSRMEDILKDSDL